jgi:hypothetical protein
MVTQPVLDSHQQPPQLLALTIVQANEQRILSTTLVLRGTPETLLTGGGDPHPMTTAICGIPLSRDQTIGLQWIEHGHQDARIGPHCLPQIRLTHRSMIVQQAKQVELTRRQMTCCVRIPQPAHRDMPQQGQQQPGTRASLGKHAALHPTTLAHDHGTHRITIRVPIIERSI